MIVCCLHKVICRSETEEAVWGQLPYMTLPNLDSSHPSDDDPNSH